MLRRVARALVPGPVRRWVQARRTTRAVADFPRRVVRHTYGGVELTVELSDPLGAGWYDHDWDALPELALLAGGRLRPGARVFDVGAHQGVVGLQLGHRVGPGGAVVLVEPNSHNVAACRRNAELNAMPWVTAKQAAVSDTVGTLRFNGGLNGKAAEVSDYGGVVEVPAVTVDALAAEYGPPDVVFVDVEGFECRALAGAAATFAGRPDWFVEVHTGGHGLEAAGGTVEQVLAYFPAAEYDRYVHAENDPAAVPLAAARPDVLRDRFFLTALAKPRPA